MIFGPLTHRRRYVYVPPVCRQYIVFTSRHVVLVLQMPMTADTEHSSVHLARTNASLAKLLVDVVLHNYELSRPASIFCCPTYALLSVEIVLYLARHRHFDSRESTRTAEVAGYGDLLEGLGDRGRASVAMGWRAVSDSSLRFEGCSMKLAFGCSPDRSCARPSIYSEWFGLRDVIIRYSLCISQERGSTYHDCCRHRRYVHHTPSA